MRELGEQAFNWAAGLVIDASLASGRSLADCAADLTRADSVDCRGTNSDGNEISFPWSFGRDDIPEIVRTAEEAERKARQF